METRRSCVVVGGGLAGMVVARQLATSGWRVTLLEHSGRLGGKAGADLREGRLVEHGYHMFPGWYVNVRALLRDLKISLIDFDRYHYLRPVPLAERDGRPLPPVTDRLVTLRSPSSPCTVLHNVFRGILPWYNMLLFFYFLLDLVGRRLSQARLLDRVSHVGLMREAWYVTDTVAEFNQENVLKASAIPLHDVSAMTTKSVMGYWLKQPRPFVSVLAGDLQSSFIEPLKKKLDEAKVDMQLHTKVTGLGLKAGRVVGVEVEGSDGTLSCILGNVFVVCTPFEAARKWLTGDVYAIDPELGNMHLLQSRPMAALYLRLKRNLNLPREHVFLYGGRYGLSFIDLSRIWKGLPKSELSFIVSNYAPLSAVLSRKEARDALLLEIRDYLDIAEDDIENWELLPNVETPLFINTVGAWSNRPRHHTKVDNLYFAGDYVRNAVDLACMEGAVSAALNAAAAIVQDRVDAEGARVPPGWEGRSWWLLRAARWLLVPVMAPVRLIAWLAELWLMEVKSVRTVPHSEMWLLNTPGLRPTRKERALRRAAQRAAKVG